MVPHMDPLSIGSTSASRRNLRLQTLVRLRWIAVTGQAAAVLGVHFGFGFALPLAPCLALIAFSVGLNVYLHLAFPARTRLTPRYGTLLLAYDLVQLVGLLYLAGGLENPFAFLLIVPVIVSASALPMRHTLVLAFLVIVSTGVLAFFHHPLPWPGADIFHLPLLYVAGLYAAFVAVLLFTGIHVWRIAEETRQMSAALEATEVALAREQRLAALDGLAAAAAHELGTPLGTISIVVKEMLHATPPHDPTLDDLRLLKTQVDRCREILGTLASRGEAPDAHFARLPLSSLIEEVVEPHRDFGIPIHVSVAPATGAEATPEPVGRRNPAVLHGLGNLVENALDFATGAVTVRAEWSAEEVRVTIGDDGPGFAPEVIDRLGEPYVTTRGRRQRAAPDDEFGLGLGFFIAKTLLERSGARISFANRPKPAHGAVVVLVWPRARMDAADDNDDFDDSDDLT